MLFRTGVGSGLGAGVGLGVGASVGLGVGASVGLGVGAGIEVELEHQLHATGQLALSSLASAADRPPDVQSNPSHS